MAKQKIYAIGPTVELAHISQLLEIISPRTASGPQLEITKELLTPALSSKMNFYPDLTVALGQAVKDASDYEGYGYYNKFSPVFLVEVEDTDNNQKYEVTRILKAYVIRTNKDDAPVSECEINMSAKQALEKKNNWISSIFSAENTNTKIICDKNNYHGDFSALQLNKQRWTLCNIQFFGSKEGRGDVNNHAAKLPKEILQPICEYIRRTPLKLAK